MKQFVKPGQVIEVRGLNVKSGNFTNTLSGYFDTDHIEDLVKSVDQLGEATGIYFTMNPCKPALHARAANRMRKMAGKDAATSDADILKRSWILIDIDVQRPSGISATDEEKAQAWALAEQIRDYLKKQGWPEPIEADSGNGYHLYFPVDLPAEDGGLVKRILANLAQRFNGGPAKVDTSVFNSARITKLPGTLACKGDNTPERPHRPSRIITAPQTLTEVPKALLEALAGPPEASSKVPTPQASSSGSAAYDVPAFLVRNGLEVTDPKPYAEGGQIWVFKQCPYRKSDGNTAFIAQLASGAVVAGCQHDTCPGSKSTGNHWPELRSRFRHTEPAPPTVAGASWPEPWEDPFPLISQVPREDYPLDALPQVVHEAVQEVQGFTQAPLSMVATAAMAAISLAAQPHGDIQRSEKLTGPASVFFVIIADSGERKSTNEGFFFRAARNYQDEQTANAFGPMLEYRTALDAWDAKKAGLKDKIRALAKAGTSTTKIESDLCDHEHKKPTKPRIPRLLFSDITAEELKHQLATQWSSAAIASSEAGAVFGSHAMKQDSVMQTLATYNQLWDGATITTDRRTTESSTVKGARLTMSLQVQEPVLRSFLDKAGDVARGSGFLARCLFALPESTQGTRFFREPPERWPALERFNHCITTLLRLPLSIASDGAMSPPMLVMSPEAKTAWVAFHDSVECQLAAGGELYDVRDVASKVADNAARVAALFHIFDFQPGPVGVGAVNSACRVVAWHLNEARRFFGELALPKHLADASRLEEWCLSWHLKHGDKAVGVPTREIQRLGPNSLRDQSTFETATRELLRLGRAQLVLDGKKRFLLFNPALLVPPAPAPAPAPKPKAKASKASKASNDRLAQRIEAAKPKRKKYA